jgi:DNA-binding transcriptional LysR family regulator
LGLVDLLPATIYDFRSKYPNITVALDQMSSADQLKALEERRLDLGISRKPSGPLPQTIELIKLYDDPLVLAVHHSNPLAVVKSTRIVAARDMPFVISHLGAISSYRDTILTLCRAARFAPNIVKEVQGIITMLGLVAANIGVAVVPLSIRQMGLRGVTLVPLEDAGAVATLYMTSMRSNPPEVRRPLDELKKMLLETNRNREIVATNASCAT